MPEQVRQPEPSRTGLPFAISRLILKRKLRPVLLAVVVLFVLAEVIILSPSPLEEWPGSSTPALEPEALVQEESRALATGIPKGKIPDYTVEKFSYVSVQGGEKQWKLKADKAFLYNQDNLVHGRIAHADLFDSEGRITQVDGLEAKYHMNKRDLEVFGKVKTVFPDGYQLYSDYLRYLPGEKKIEIPVRYLVRGSGKVTGEQYLDFTSKGLESNMDSGEIVLPKSVRMTMVRVTKDGGTDPTTIDSDRCLVHRTKKVAEFTMAPSRPINDRFVRISQPTLIGRARRAQLNYADGPQILQYMLLYQDVLIKEAGRKRYATGAEADFDAKQDLITLKGFPQVYQENDTVTGDVIIVHRDTDVVEVENSNSFSEGEQEQ